MGVLIGSSLGVLVGTSVEGVSSSIWHSNAFKSLGFSHDPDLIIVRESLPTTVGFFLGPVKQYAQILV